MKILYLHNVPIDSQKANLIQVKSMCDAMYRLGFDVTLSLPSKNKRVLIDENELKYNLHYRKQVINISKIDKYINYKKVRNIVNILNPDICYLRAPLLLKQVISTGKPIIIELHNNRLHERYAILDNYWKKVLLDSIDNGTVIKIVCISNALTEYWEKSGVPFSRIITAHDGFDSNMFSRMRDKQEIRKKLNLPLEERIITYAGRLYKNRKIENIISLAKYYEKVLFIIIGGPDEVSRELNRVVESQRLNNVKLTGQIPHEKVPDYLFASDILLALWSSDVPTINYCSPLKIFEYMAAGRVIIASAFPTINEVLQHNRNAILVEPDSLKDLIDKTGDVLINKYNQYIGETARKDAFNNYTWDKRVEYIFNDLIN